MLMAPQNGMAMPNGYAGLMANRWQAPQTPAQMPQPIAQPQPMPIGPAQPSPIQVNPQPQPVAPMQPWGGQPPIAQPQPMPMQPMQNAAPQQQPNNFAPLSNIRRPVTM